MITKINLDGLSKLGISVLQFNLMLGLMHNPTAAEIEELLNKGLVQFNYLRDSETGDILDNKQFELTTEGEALVNKMTYQITNFRSAEKIPELAKQMRELFPTGKKDGLPYYWRGNTPEIEKRLSLFKAKNPQYTNEQILKATENYIKSFENNRTYMQILKYFIEKNGESQLLTYIENIGSANEITKADWTSQIK